MALKLEIAYNSSSFTSVYCGEIVIIIFFQNHFNKLFGSISKPKIVVTVLHIIIPKVLLLLVYDIAAKTQSRRKGEGFLYLLLGLNLRIQNLSSA